MTPAERQTEADLVAAAQGGSEAAFSALVATWGRRLTAHAWRLLGDGEAARDVSQSAWLEIARGLNQLRDPMAFPAWAYRIVSRRAAAHIRSLQSDRRLVRDLEQAGQIAPEPPNDPSDQAQSRALQAAIRALPPAQRAAIALHHFEGLSVAETAVALDTPVGTIKTRLMHARLKLRAALQGATDD